MVINHVYMWQFHWQHARCAVQLFNLVTVFFEMWVPYMYWQVVLKLWAYQGHVCSLLSLHTSTVHCIALLKGVRMRFAFVRAQFNYMFCPPQCYSNAYWLVIFGVMLTAPLCTGVTLALIRSVSNSPVFSDRLKRATSGSESQGAPSFKSQPGTQSWPQDLEGSVRHPQSPITTPPHH